MTKMNTKRLKKIFELMENYKIESYEEGEVKVKRESKFFEQLMFDQNEKDEQKLLKRRGIS